MRIGFDIDGVLASFESGAAPLLARLTGRDLFPPDFTQGNLDPPVWNWPEHYGYTDKEIAHMWREIRSDPAFWLNLRPTVHVDTLAVLISELERKHDIYYVTNRSGVRPKRQTEIWLFEHLAYPLRVPSVWPTVLTVALRMKGAVARTLQLDCYIDDNFDNAQDCAEQSPSTRTYLLNRAYNWRREPHPQIVRVNSLSRMFDMELGNL